MTLLHKPHVFFLFIALIWGMVLVFITPPFQVPDEPAHFFRSYQIADGSFFPEAQNNLVGGTLPSGLSKILPPFETLVHKPKERIGLNTLLQAHKIPLDPQNTEFIQFPNTARMFPLPYLPQATGIFFGKILHAPPLILLYLGRLINLMVWISLVFVSIKIIPVYKWLMVMLALLPMSIFEAASLSGDVFTNAIAFIGISLFLNYTLNDKKKIGNSEIALMAFVALLIALSKNAYFLIFLLVFLIPANKFGSGKKRISSLLIIVATGISGILISGIFTNLVYGLIEPGQPFWQSLDETLKKVNPVDQLNYILVHPITYSKTLIDTFIKQGDFLIRSFIGILGWLDVWFHGLFYALAGAILLTVALLETTKSITITLKQKLWMLLLFAGTILILTTALYLTWTPVGKNLIVGLQGRYFIPVTPLFFLLFYNRKLSLPDRVIPIAASGFVFISFIVTTYALYQRYWDFF